MNPETARLDDADKRNIPWRKWGPYISERQWGTVREDYSKDGTPGTTSRMTKRGLAPIAGAKTASAAFPTRTRCSALRWRFGMVRSDPEGAPVRPDEQ